MFTFEQLYSCQPHLLNGISGQMQTKSGNILVIDDDHDVLTAASLFLKRYFAYVATDSEPRNLPALLAERGWDVVLLDMNFGIGANSGEEGLHWLSEIQKLQPEAAVVLMTAYGAVDTAVKAMKYGAIDFVLKPWHNERLLTTIQNAVKLRSSEEEVQRLRTREKVFSPPLPKGEMIGRSAAMHKVYTIIDKAGPTDANVLILGANGTGKELVARELFKKSTRKNEVFVTVDLGSISESLFESELFGHKKGAFTGATADRIGRLQAASKGTLFLDEIGNLPLHLQSKLLSVLEQRQVLPLGSNKPVPIDIRLICATNMPLAQMVKEGRFRKDLLYRINTVELPLPALKERTEDIAALLEHFIALYCNKYKLPTKQLSTRARSALLSYDWPGNVRELRHAAERAVIMSSNDLLEANEFLTAGSGPLQATIKATPEFGTLNLEELEKTAIVTALHNHAGNISHAALTLGITRTALYRRMEKYGL